MIGSEIDNRSTMPLHKQIQIDLLVDENGIKVEHGQFVDTLREGFSLNLSRANGFVKGEKKFDK